MATKVKKLGKVADSTKSELKVVENKVVPMENVAATEKESAVKVTEKESAAKATEKEAVVKEATATEKESVVKETAKEVVKEETTAKEEVVEKVTAKAPAKKATKARATKKTTKTEVKTSEFETEAILQYQGIEVSQKELVDKVVDIWTNVFGKTKKSIKEIKLYIKPEEYSAYYVINGKETGRIDL